MNGIIKNFRRGKRTVTPNHFIIVVDGMDSKAKASKLIGKKVHWKTSSGKLMKGKISAVHGNKGAVRARFEKGLPGTAVGTKIVIHA